MARSRDHDTERNPTAIRLRFAVLTAAALWIGSTSSTVFADESLSFVIDSHKASRQLLDPLACRVRFEQMPDENVARKTLWEADYYRSRSRVRVVAQDSNDTLDKLLENNTLSSYSKRNSTKAVILHPNVYLSRNDVFVESLMAVNRPNTLEYFDLESIVAESRVTKASSGKPGEFDIELRLDSERAESKIQMVLLKRYNYLIDRIKYTITTKKGTTIRDSHVRKYNEIKPGTYMPVEIATSISVEDKPVGSYVATLERCRTAPLSNEVFQQSIKTKHRIGDAIKGIVYSVDARGQKTGSVDALGRFPPPTAPVPGQSDRETGYVDPDEPPRSQKWLYVVVPSVAILFLGIFHFLKRRRQDHSDASTNR